MPVFNVNNASCTVYTHKEGVAARLAHDLKITCHRFSIDIDDEWEYVKGMFDPRSLEVACARKEGRDDLRELSEADKRKIDGHMHDDVLCVVRFPTIEFHSMRIKKDTKHAEIEGDLILHGHRKSVRGIAVLENNNWTATFIIHQPDFGI